MLIDYYRQGRMPFDRLIRFYRFEQIAEAFHDMEHGATIKPVLRMEDWDERLSRPRSRRFSARARPANSRSITPRLGADLGGRESNSRGWDQL